MTAAPRPVVPSASPARDRTPVYLAGIAAILLALIVFTPVLINPGSPSFLTNARLIVDRTPGSSTTDFYLQAWSGYVRYSTLELDLGTGFSWNGSCPSSGLTWTNLAQHDLLELSVRPNATGPMVVDATAVYSSGGSETIYAAEIAFEVVNEGQPDESLLMVPCPATPGESPPASWPVAQLPYSLLLVNYGGAGPP